jgi:glycosyltransferase involved in cell wall biosynthesis
MREMSVALSVIIPAYNRCRVIGAAVQSVLQQQLPTRDWTCEIIIVDDGSSDDLEQALAPFGEHVRLLRHAKNAGAAAARNTGIEAASGEYVALLDSDDIWLPGKVIQQVAAMQQYGWGASCTAFMLVEPDCREVVAPDLATQAISLSEVVWGCMVSPGSTLMCRRSLFASVGPFDTALTRLEDWDWLLRLARLEPLGFLAQPLARISPSGTPGPGVIQPAAAKLWEKHADSLDPRVRRKFASGLDVERAAAHYRDGAYLAATLLLGRSLLHAPIGNNRAANVVKRQLTRLFSR